MFAEEIKQSSGQLLACIDNLSEKQAQFKPLPQVWSILECVEHIFIVDYGIFKIICKEPAEPTDSTSANELHGEEKLKGFLNDRSKKYQAPETVQPKGRFAKLTDAAEKFSKLRAELTEALQNNRIIFDSQTIRHPLLGEMTKKDWLHFLVHHCQRHIRQIEMMKADIHFPGY